MDKDQLKSKAEETVNGIKGQIAELETKLESATGDARAKIEEQLEKLNLNVYSRKIRQFRRFSGRKVEGFKRAN
ncbi:MAG: hypothetical protein R2801_02425 [Chitinophagales bacterium]